MLDRWAASVIFLSGKWDTGLIGSKWWTNIGQDVQVNIIALFKKIGIVYAGIIV